MTQRFILQASGQADPRRRRSVDDVSHRQRPQQEASMLSSHNHDPAVIEHTDVDVGLHHRRRQRASLDESAMGKPRTHEVAGADMGAPRRRRQRASLDESSLTKPRTSDISTASTAHVAVWDV